MTMERAAVTEPFAHILRTLAAVARRHGFVIYAVGGFVRDLYLGRQSKDLDIMVEGDNGGIRFAETVARDLGLRAPVIFRRFGTAKLSMEGQDIEFVMPRSERYTEHSRNPETSCGTIEGDARRRDFTMNALFWRLNDDTVLDLTGRGLTDIAARTIRVTDPDNAGIIFSQDPLRMMRAIRQSVQLDFAIDPAALAAIAANAFRLPIVAVERVQDELTAMLVSARPAQACALLVETGLFDHVFTDPALRAAKDRFSSCAGLVLSSIDDDVALRLAAFFLDADVPGDADASRAAAALLRLKYASNVTRDVTAFIRCVPDICACGSQSTDTDVRALILHCGTALNGALWLARARARLLGGENAAAGVDALFRRVQEAQVVMRVSEMGHLLSGDDLMALLQRSPGPWIQAAKDRIIRAQIENPSLTRDQAIALVRAASADNVL